MAERRLQGRPASPGLALGPLFVLAETRNTAERVSSSAEIEIDRLRAAIKRASDQLNAVSASLAQDARAILEFQVEMLGDEALAAPALAAIAAGAAGETAWSATLDAMIADYAGADDEYFRARASDLEDLKGRVLDVLVGRQHEPVPDGSVLIARDLAPSRFLGIAWREGAGIALAAGSPTSHVALLARARGVPMVVGLGADVLKLASGQQALVDGALGTLVTTPDAATFAAAKERDVEDAQRQQAAERFRLKPARMRNGESVVVMINTAGPDELESLDPAMCDGIGLVRSEFLFYDGARLPDENTQYRAYRRILEWAGTRPVTIRTLDAGGDKPIKGLTLDDEGNPFLGTRGIRLSLLKPEVFRVQLRALCRAAVHGQLKIMLPMVAVPSDLAQARVHLARALAELAAEGVVHARPTLGIMVEVPAVAIAIDRFDADFYSIGSNDLIQYVMAAARDIGTLSAYADASDPAVISLIAHTVEHGRRTGREVSLCGDAASDPALMPHLLKAGLRSLSVSVTAVGAVKAAIAEVDAERQP